MATNQNTITTASSTTTRKDNLTPAAKTITRMIRAVDVALQCRRVEQCAGELTDEATTMYNEYYRVIRPLNNTQKEQVQSLINYSI